MSDPIRFFNGIALEQFYTDRKARREEYSSILEKYYDEIFWKGNIVHYSHLLNEQHVYSDYADSRTIEPYVNYSVECYHERERLFLAQVKKQILSDLDTEKIKVYVTLIIKSLIQLSGKIDNLLLDEEHRRYKDNILLRLQNCMSNLQETYLPNISIPANTSAPKIQWLGKTNVLVTLIYDLWKGQDKGRNTPTTPPQINAMKNELEAFLINNFIDSKGKRLTQFVVSDYLNVSKSEKRAKKGVRIEIEIPKK